MDINNSKIALTKAILEIESQELIQKITNLIKKEEADFWDELSISQQKEIEKGIRELDRGKRISLDSVLKKIS